MDKVSGLKRKPELDMFCDNTPSKVQVIEGNSAGTEYKPQMPTQLLTEVQRFEQEIQALASGNGPSVNKTTLKSITKTIVRKPVTKTISAPPTYNKDALDEKKSGLSSPPPALIINTPTLPTPTSSFYYTPSTNIGVNGTAVQKKDDSEKRSKPKKYVRKAAGQSWEDPTLSEWPDDDFRIFCGDLGNEVTDDMLSNAFSKYTSFSKAKVIRDKRTGKTKGYGFVSFSDPMEFIKALNEMNGKYIGNRPVKLRKSKWEERNDVATIKKEASSGKKEKKKKKKE